LEKAAAAIEILLLGPVEAVADGRVAPLGGPRQRALLALLLLDPGRAMSAGRLADELWQGSPPTGAERTLRSYVSRLRRALGHDAVTTEAGGYAFAAGARLDVTRFEQLLREGRSALARGAAGLAAERLHAALALWRGRALADVGDGGSLAAEAQRLDELRLVCLEERIDADLALGHHAALVSELRVLVQREPLRERFWRQLVLALYRSERQAEALAAYRDASRLLDTELGLEPGTDLKQLEVAILRQEVEAVDAVEALHNLPGSTTSFVGRDGELADLAELLGVHRLVTVTGIGGAGKTRLAVEAARQQVGRCADGVWLVDLSPVFDPELVPGTVATTWGVEAGSAGGLVDALVLHARRRELLLLLDNCEHLVVACAELAETVLRACPNVRILATSRAPLGVGGEVDYALDPLATPGADAAVEELEGLPAVRLFLERASAVRRDLPRDGEALVLMGSICRELDGLPLAIELAAARAKALSLPEIAARLDDRFRFLRAWQRVADPRHQTLQTTMNWSYELLSEEERRLLRRLAVFAGGALLDAIADVCLGGDTEAAAELLSRLVDASLVRADGEREMRYRLLETVRQYGAAKVEEDPDVEELRRRHAAYYLRVAESAKLALDSLGHGPQHHEPVLREQQNLRAALDWASGRDVELALRLMLALENFWVTHALAEGRRRFEQLLARARDVDPLLLARSTRDYASCLDVLQEFAAARQAYERSRELYREEGDTIGVAYLDYRLGIIAMHLDRDVDETRRLWTASLATFREHGDRIGELQALGDLGFVELRFGDEARGREMVEASLETAREAGWVWWETQNVLKLAALAVEAGRIDEAERRARECLPVCLRMGHRQFALFALAVLARTAAARGEDDRALTLWASVEAVDDAPGRFGKFDREAYAGSMPDLPLPAPLPLEEAAAVALSG
jgi:predicted ATPase/DNA-binding SARP family transcriptional activator